MSRSRVRLIAVLALFGGLSLAAAQRRPSREVQNVAAFARLFGVVRHFYPSDAAAVLDWNRFAEHGIAAVRHAPDVHALESELKRLFSPLGPGIEITARLLPASQAQPARGAQVSWQYLGVPLPWPVPRGVFTMKRLGRPYIRGAAISEQRVSAGDIRGKRVRLSGRVRAVPLDESGIAVLSLRVARGAAGDGFSDFMRDRPIRIPEWREYSIEGVVDPDATEITVGILASGGITADFDDIRLAAQEQSGGPWLSVPLRDGGFEGASNPAAVSWTPPGFKAVRSERVDGDAPEGSRFHRFSPLPESANARLFEGTPAADFADVELGSGLRARVPLVLEEKHEVDSAAREALRQLRARLAASAAPNRSLTAEERLTDVVVLWNLLRHFYPYWTEVPVDWDARLPVDLERALAARTRSDHLNTLRTAVAEIRDGHSRVLDKAVETYVCALCPASATGRAFLPLRFGLVGGRVVATATASKLVAVGDEISAIDGQRVESSLASLNSLISGSDQWRSVRALAELTTCRKGTAVRMQLRSEKRTPRSASLTCDQTAAPSEVRPDAIAELQPGVWYVDVTRALTNELEPRMSELAKAKGIVFDVRGYPTGASTFLTRHLLAAAHSDPWLYVARINAPFGKFAGWNTVPYGLSAATPRLTGNLVFMTDARAISAAEVFLGYVSGLKLGTIIGSPTAGANGNLVDFPLPGGFSVSFSGMRATHLDGRTAYHGLGIRPDVSVAPTVEGLRSGRDELLERAVAIAGGDPR